MPKLPGVNHLDAVRRLQPLALEDEFVSGSGFAISRTIRAFAFSFLSSPIRSNFDRGIAQLRR